MARKAKPAVDAADVLKLMYPDLPTSEDYTDPLGAAIEADKARTAAPVDNGKLTALEQQVAALQGQLSQARQTSQALMTQATTDLPPAKPQFDYSKAPDPTLEPAAFAQYMAQIGEANIQYEKNLYAWQQGQANAVAQRTAHLWDAFSESYPDYAKRGKHVEIAAAEVIQKAKLAGRDVDKYMYGAAGDFMKDVADEMDKLWPTSGKPLGGDDDDDEEDDRTDMLGGGAGGNGVASARGGQKPPEQYGALGKDVLAWQKATGFHG